MGCGKERKNNGLVILLVTDQRCIQFYTGYGLEGDLPDAICKRIQTRDMIPYLKDGNWDAGMVAGVRAVCGRLDGSMVNDTDDEEDISFSVFWQQLSDSLLLPEESVGWRHVPQANAPTAGSTNCNVPAAKWFHGSTE